MEEKKYYSLKDVLNWLNFDYQFELKKPYPFNRKREDITFSWGQILIPKKGIRETVQNKISDIKECPLDEIVMMYQIPFKVEDKHRNTNIGVINQDISLTFRYDKEYKYGNINKSIYEVCFYILENAVETNDFFIITSDSLFTFLSYYVIDNQWGIGALNVSSPPTSKYIIPLNKFNSDYCINCCHLDNDDNCLLKTKCENGKEFAWEKPTEKSENNIDTVKEIISTDKVKNLIQNAIESMKEDLNNNFISAENISYTDGLIAGLHLALGYIDGDDNND